MEVTIPLICFFPPPLQPINFGLSGKLFCFRKEIEAQDLGTSKEDKTPTKGPAESVEKANAEETKPPKGISGSQSEIKDTTKRIAQNSGPVPIEIDESSEDNSNLRKMRGVEEIQVDPSDQKKSGKESKKESATGTENQGKMASEQEAVVGGKLNELGVIANAELDAAKVEKLEVKEAENIGNSERGNKANSVELKQREQPGSSVGRRGEAGPSDSRSGKSVVERPPNTRPQPVVPPLMDRFYNLDPTSDLGKLDNFLTNLKNSMESIEEAANFVMEQMGRGDNNKRVTL